MKRVLILLLLAMALLLIPTLSISAPSWVSPTISIIKETSDLLQSPAERPYEWFRTDIGQERLEASSYLVNPYFKAQTRMENKTFFATIKMEKGKEISREMIDFDHKTGEITRTLTDYTVKLQGRWKEEERVISADQAEKLASVWLKKARSYVDSVRKEIQKELQRTISEVKSFIEQHKNIGLADKIDVDKHFSWKSEIYTTKLGDKRKLEGAILKNNEVAFGYEEYRTDGKVRRRECWFYNLQTGKRLYKIEAWDPDEKKYIYKEDVPSFKRIIIEGRDWLRLAKSLLTK